jgi:serine/threonine protein kinase
LSYQPGFRFGVYEIVSPLGAGGMGEVFRARDTKLGREAAIKVLPQVFVADPDRVARFQREAQLLAALNHPHIAGIYGLEEHEGARFLVMELVERESLAARLAGGPLAIDEALAIASEISSATRTSRRTGSGSSAPARCGKARRRRRAQWHLKSRSSSTGSRN